MRAHDLKHTFGRRLRTAGVPLETRKVLLGHKTGDITSHYSAPELAELIRASNCPILARPAGFEPTTPWFVDFCFEPKHQYHQPLALRRPSHLFRTERNGAGLNYAILTHCLRPATGIVISSGHEFHPGNLATRDLLARRPRRGRRHRTPRAAHLLQLRLSQIKARADRKAKHDRRMRTPGLDFKAIHDHFRPRVLRYVTRLVGEADGEDVTQSVMLKVKEGLSGFRGDSSVSTWIYRIATNVALDKRREKGIQALTDSGYEFNEDDLPPAAESPSVETTAIRAEMNACISEFVDRLPENYKTVMILGELEGFTNGEIAAILGLTLDTVKIRLHRARQKLRKDLQAGCNFYSDERAELACDRKPPAAPITFSRRR